MMIMMVTNSALAVIEKAKEDKLKAARTKEAAAAAKRDQLLLLQKRRNLEAQVSSSFGAPPRTRDSKKQKTKEAASRVLKTFAAATPLSRSSSSSIPDAIQVTPNTESSRSATSVKKASSSPLKTVFDTNDSYSQGNHEDDSTITSSSDISTTKFEDMSGTSISVKDHRKIVDDALKRAEEQREREVASLKKQISGLQKQEEALAALLEDPSKSVNLDCDPILKARLRQKENQIQELQKAKAELEEQLKKLNKKHKTLETKCKNQEKSFKEKMSNKALRDEETLAAAEESTVKNLKEQLKGKEKLIQDLTAGNKDLNEELKKLVQKDSADLILKQVEKYFN